MSVKYSWSRQNGAAVPPVRFMSIEPAEDYYKGMPLKLKENGIVEPTDGDPEYICMAQYDPDAEIQPLEIPVQEVFPDVIYEKINNDGTTEEVRFGSRGGGGGVSSWNDLTDKPFGETTTSAPLNITFDGDATGKETLDIGATLVKVSDEFLDFDMLVGSSLTVVNNVGVETTKELTAEDVVDMSDQGLPGFFVFHNDNPYVICMRSDVENGGVLFKAGVWFMCSEDFGYVKSLSNPNATITTTEIQKLDPKFYDRPCYEDYEVTDIVTEKTFNFERPGYGEREGQVYSQVYYTEFDGVHFGIESHKLIVGDMYIVTFDGVPYRMVAEKYDRLGNETGTPDPVYIEAGSQGFTYIYTKNVGKHTISIKHVSPIIKKLDEKFLPDHKHKWNDISDAPFYDRSKSEPLNITFDGDLTNHETVELGEGSYYVKMSDNILTINEIIGSTLDVVLGGENVSISLTSEIVQDLTAHGLPAILVASSEDVDHPSVMIVNGDLSGMGLPLSVGVWFVYAGDSSYTKSLSNPNVTITTTELKKLDNKYIDAEWMAKGGQEQFEGEIVSNRTVQSASIGGGSDLRGYASNYDLIKEGDGLRVVWNGKDYNITVKAATISAYGYTINVLYAGNYGAVLSNQGMSSSVAATGEPFDIIFGQTNIQTGEFERMLDASVATEEATGVENTISIYAESSIVPLPEKFMPELTQVVLISPSGKKFKTTVGDDGVLTTTEV